MALYCRNPQTSLYTSVPKSHVLKFILKFPAFVSQSQIFVSVNSYNSSKSNYQNLRVGIVSHMHAYENAVLSFNE